jgi:hypothetical protein
VVCYLGEALFGLTSRSAGPSRPCAASARLGLVQKGNSAVVIPGSLAMVETKGPDLPTHQGLVIALSRKQSRSNGGSLGPFGSDTACGFHLASLRAFAPWQTQIKLPFTAAPGSWKNSLRGKQGLGSCLSEHHYQAPVRDQKKKKKLGVKTWQRCPGALMEGHLEKRCELELAQVGVVVLKLCSQGPEGCDHQARWSGQPWLPLGPPSQGAFLY